LSFQTSPGIVVGRLPDNGKVFTGRYGLHPTEVLFDRILSENGISHRLTAIRSPTATGKVERFHQSLRKEFLSHRKLHHPRGGTDQALDMVNEYNTERPTSPWRCGARRTVRRLGCDCIPVVDHNHSYLAAIRRPGRLTF
jgi:hypothetical protein